MNRFHIYQAIGHGKHSTVYKGRMKKTIEYYAIKSVEKSQKNKILQEVKVLHSLDHPNVLKFYTWCESTAHLWLVLEYCVGSDLMSLLRQDQHLPEESVHELAYDIVKALQYIHSQGIIYCDLKPSNMLLDENGRLKLCDFGLARRSADISKIPSSSLPQAKRGTPSYMAPELFEDGVHSYASDFWALGCVLYECYTGRPPFVGKEFTQLVNSILSDPTPPLPGNPSRSFVNLIDSLLIKDPSERIKWPELCGHAFWRTKLTLVPLPAEPAFDSMIALRARPCLSEHNGDRSGKSKTPPRHREKDARGHSKHDENSAVGPRGYETPTKAALSARKMQAKTVGRVEEKNKDSSKATRAVNLLRLSRIAKLNLQKENEKENYRRAPPSGPENDSEVKIENTDMELDFNENAEDEAPEEQDGSDIPDSSPADNPSSEKQNQKEEVDMEVDMQIDTPPAPAVPVSDESGALEHESSLDVTPASTPSSQLKIQRTGESPAPIPEYDSSKSSSDLSQILWHPSDLSVRPVMPSKKADRAAEMFPSLPFEALQASDFVKMPKGQLDALSNKIITIITGNASSGEKQNVVRYLEMLSSNPGAANILTNGPIMLSLVKLLRVSKANVLRVQFASLIGLLIRHSTFIEDDLSHSGIISSLTEALRDGQEKVRRFSMAALGELLFYISTQNEQNKDNPTETPMKDGRSASTWQVPNSLISLVSSVLRKGQDDLTQLYALRTIENICSQGAWWATRFTSQDVISNLCYIYRAQGKQESMRLTAGSCLVRIVRFSPPSIQWVIEKLSFKEIASSLVKGSLREQQISLNLLNMAMLGTSIGRHLMQLMEEKNLVPCLVSLIEQGAEVLKGKALLLVALLCKNGKRWLSQFFGSAKVISAVDRVAKEKDNYVQQCLTASVHIVASIVPNLLENVARDIQQMTGGRKHGMSPLNSRTVPKTNIHMFSVIVNLLGSASFKHRVANCQVQQQLAKILKLVENPFQGRDELQLSLLRVIEAMTEESAWILGSADVYIHEILPNLVSLYRSSKDADARFNCLKILYDVMLTFFNESTDLESREDDLKSVAIKHFLPLYPTMIEDEDLIPMYAQKLLLMFVEFNYIAISDIVQPKIVSKCFEFFRRELSSATVNDVKLCLALASAPEMETKLLSQLKVVRRIGNLLEYVHIKDMEDFVEPTLGLCRAFLRRSLGSTNYDIHLDPNIAADQQQLAIKDTVDFSSYVGVFLDLTRVREGNISGLASECLVLLWKVAPRESTAGVLTNLPKVSPILESWNKGTSHVTVLRILQALTCSCRQYLVQKMIISVSTSEVSKISYVVSEIKSSNIPALTTAANQCASELRRLSHG